MYVCRLFTVQLSFLVAVSSDSNIIAELIGIVLVIKFSHMCIVVIHTLLNVSRICTLQLAL